DVIRLVQYGIPQMTDKTKDWIATDKDREYFRVPDDPEQDACKALFKMLREVDAWVLKNKDVIFGAEASKYTYSPIVKEPNQGENPDPSKPARMKFCKVKFDTDF